MHGIRIGGHDLLLGSETDECTFDQFAALLDLFYCRGESVGLLRSVLTTFTYGEGNAGVLFEFVEVVN